MKKISILFAFMFLIAFASYFTTSTFKANPIRDKQTAVLSADEANYYAEIDEYYEQTFQTSDIDNFNAIEEVFVYDGKGNLLQTLSSVNGEQVNTNNLVKGAELLMTDGATSYYIVL